MRFMILVRAAETSAAPMAPWQGAMAAYHDELARAGVLLDAHELRPRREAWRVQAAGGRAQVVEGAFVEEGAALVSCTLIQAPSIAAALEWSRRCPVQVGEGSAVQVEVRQLVESGEVTVPGQARGPGDPCGWSGAWR